MNSRGNHSGIRGKRVAEGNKEGMTVKVEVAVNVAQRANGPMDKYVKTTRMTRGETKSRVGKEGKDTKLVDKAMIDPKNPRKKPNRRTRRKLLQLYKVQSQPTLNWFGFRREVEGRKVHSADFAEAITYEHLEELYRVEDLTYLGVRQESGQEMGLEGMGTDGMRVVSLNIRTLTMHKVPVIGWYMRKYALDCLMLQDVGCTELELRYLRNEIKHLLGGDTVVTVAPAGQQGGDEGQVGGLMTIIRPLGLEFVTHKVDKLELGLTQTTTCKWGPHYLHFINTYWPVENKEGENSLWNMTARALKAREYKVTPLLYVQSAILRERDKLITEYPGSMVLIAGDLNSTIRREERGGRTAPLDRWLVDNKLVSVRESLTGDDTGTRMIDRWATHYVGLEATSVIDHFLLHGNGWENQIKGYGVDQNQEFQHYTDHRPVLCVINAGPRNIGTENRECEATPWIPVIKHKDLVERFRKKMDRWYSQSAQSLGPMSVEERYKTVITAIRDIGVPLAERSRKRLEEKRAAYKHGWSPEFVARKAKMDFMLEVRRILKVGQGCQEMQAQNVREAANRWEQQVKRHMIDTTEQQRLLEGNHGLTFWRLATLGQMAACHQKEYEDAKKDIHGKRREALRLKMGDHIQRREEKRAEGKLKKVIDSILKKTRIMADLRCFIDADGKLQTDLRKGHNKLTEDFEEWYRTPADHVNNESLFSRSWREICKGRREFMENLTNTDIPKEIRELFWDAVVHTPRREEISQEIGRALNNVPTFDEFMGALKACKDGSSPGPNQVSYGLIKQLPQVILQEVYQLLCDIWEQRLTPEEWKLKWQQPIPKTMDSGTGICRVEDFRPLGLVDTLRKLWTKLIIQKIQGVWEGVGIARTHLEEDHVNASQHGFRAHRGTDTALAQLVNALEQAEQSDSSIGISSFDIRRAFDSVSKSLIHLGWIRLGVPEDVVEWLQAMDEGAFTVVRSPFAMGIQKEEGIEGLWKAIKNGNLSAFIAERGTAQGDVSSPATWMCIFDILLTMLKLGNMKERFYIRHGSELSAVPPNAYADDLVVVMANVKGLQEVSDIVSGFCAICNLTILPAKLRTFVHSFGNILPVAQQELITYHGRHWEAKRTEVKGHSEEAGPLKYLGVLTNMDNSYLNLHQVLSQKIAQHCALVGRARASGETKAVVAQASVLKSIEYAAVWANWSLAEYRKLDVLFSNLLKDAARNMRSHPNLALYMSRETMGQGFLRLSDEVQYRKWNFIQRSGMGHRDVRRTGQSLLDHAATRVQVDSVTGRAKLITRRHRDVTEVWCGSLLEWLKEAGYGIYVHGARVETGSNEPIYDGMQGLDMDVRQFLETFNIQVWGDMVTFGEDGRPYWRTPEEIPSRLRQLMDRKTPPRRMAYI